MTCPACGGPAANVNDPGFSKPGLCLVWRTDSACFKAPPVDPPAILAKLREGVARDRRYGIRCDRTAPWLRDRVRAYIRSQGA